MTFTLSKKEARQLGIIPPPATPSEYSPMNNLESDYAAHLEQRKMVGEILDYRFEPFKLILVHGVPGKRKEMTYKPDFLVVGGRRFRLIEPRPLWVEIHEVKGYWREDARLKIKMAAELFPWFSFYGVTRVKGKWEYEGF